MIKDDCDQIVGSKSTATVNRGVTKLTYIVKDSEDMKVMKDLAEQISKVASKYHMFWIGDKGIGVRNDQIMWYRSQVD